MSGIKFVLIVGNLSSQGYEMRMKAVEYSKQGAIALMPLGLEQLYGSRHGEDELHLENQDLDMKLEISDELCVVGKVMGYYQILSLVKRARKKGVRVVYTDPELQRLYGSK